MNNPLSLHCFKLNRNSQLNVLERYLLDKNKNHPPPSNESNSSYSKDLPFTTNNKKRRHLLLDCREKQKRQFYSREFSDEQMEQEQHSFGRDHSLFQKISRRSKSKDNQSLIKILLNDITNRPQEEATKPKLKLGQRQIHINKKNIQMERTDLEDNNISFEQKKDSKKSIRKSIQQMKQVNIKRNVAQEIEVHLIPLQKKTLYTPLKQYRSSNITQRISFQQGLLNSKKQTFRTNKLSSKVKTQEITINRMNLQNFIIKKRCYKMQKHIPSCETTASELCKMKLTQSSNPNLTKNSQESEDISVDPWSTTEMKANDDKMDEFTD